MANVSIYSCPCMPPSHTPFYAFFQHLSPFNTLSLYFPMSKKVFLSHQPLVLSFTLLVNSPSRILSTSPNPLKVLSFTFSTTPHFIPNALPAIPNISYTHISFVNSHSSFPEPLFLTVTHFMSILKLHMSGSRGLCYPLILPLFLY